MPPRRLDPLGLPTRPNYVTGAREVELVAEFWDKVDYLCRCYQQEIRLGLGHATFNESVVRLREAAARKPFDFDVLDDLSPWIRMEIHRRARDRGGHSADEPFASVSRHALIDATTELGNEATAIPGKTGRDILSRYVEALMALLQEALGEPIVARRDDAGGNYDPVLRGPIGAVFRHVVDRLEPGVPDSEINFWLRRARKKFAGRYMRFDDFCPGYELGRRIEEGSMKMVYHTHDGRRVEAGAN